MRTLIVIVVVVVIAAVSLTASLYVVPEGQQAVITQFGKPVGVVTGAGLRFKIPFVQQVHTLEKRLLPWDGYAENMQTRDKKRIFVDTWARWRIADPMKYFQALRTLRQGFKILDDLVDSAVRDVVARYNLIEVVRSTNRELMYESEELTREEAAARDNVTTGRAAMEKQILEIASRNLRERTGIELVDVHIKRVNYIESVRGTVYARMKSERLRIAELFKSEAEEEKSRILGRTRRELDEIQGEMERQSAEIRGQADAEVTRLAAAAYGKSPDFYRFLRELEAYGKALGEKTRLILSTRHKFLDTFAAPADAKK